MTVLGNIQSVDDARDVAEDREQDVDEQVGAAAALEEHAQGRQDDGKDDLADVAAAVLATSAARPRSRQWVAREGPRGRRTLR